MIIFTYGWKFQTHLTTNNVIPKYFMLLHFYLVCMLTMVYQE